MTRVVCGFLTVSVVSIFGDFNRAQAQLIGNRTVGSAPGGIQQASPAARLGNSPSTIRSRGSAPPLIFGQQNQNGGQAGGNVTGGANNPGGLARPDSRFLRGNRQAGDFVGSNRADLKGFVGATQATPGTGATPVAANNIRIETGSQRVNRPLGPLGKNGMYYPKLDLNSIVEDEGELIANPNLSDRIEERVRERTKADVDVSFEGGVAVLRGEVRSKRESDLIETMLGFEPGVDRVRNELVVRGRNARGF
ncbi:MAG: BON domain-containing protein [Pirellula sp.]